MSPRTVRATKLWALARKILDESLAESIKPKTWLERKLGVRKSPIVEYVVVEALNENFGGREARNIDEEASLLTELSYVKLGLMRETLENELHLYQTEDRPRVAARLDNGFNEVEVRLALAKKFGPIEEELRSAIADIEDVIADYDGKVEL